MVKFLRMTFTVTDETKHEIVSRNLEGQRRSYASRARVLLMSCVRSALRALGSSDRAPRAD
jgi:hypothetical protein